VRNGTDRVLRRFYQHSAEKRAEVLCEFDCFSSKRPCFLECQTNLEELQRLHPPDAWKRLAGDVPLLSKVAKSAFTPLFAMLLAPLVSSDALTKKSIRGARHPELEQVLHEILSDYETTNGMITDATVKQNAEEVAFELGYAGFNGFTGKTGESMAQSTQDRNLKLSDVWLENFKKRFGWEHKKVRGEGASANVEKAEKARQELPSILSEFVQSVDDIYNVDETGIQFQMPPGKQITSGINRCQG